MLDTVDCLSTTVQETKNENQAVLPVSDRSTHFRMNTQKEGFWKILWHERKKCYQSDKEENQTSVILKII